MGCVAKESPESIARALLMQSGAEGVHARSAAFEQVIEHLSILISRHREPDIEVLRFPPVMSRWQLETSGYLHSFPHLLGCVSALDGEESEVRRRVEQGDWIAGLSATDLVLAPAACYPVYPLAAARGVLPENGRLFDVESWCFRREATHEADRLQTFQMREFVCMGTPCQALDFRTRWISRAEELATRLALTYRIAPASDPFFGRSGRLAALSQLEFPYLGTLTIEHLPNVTDKGIQQLAGFQSLEFLTVTGTKVTRKGAEQLRNKIPGLTVLGLP